MNVSFSQLTTQNETPSQSSGPTSLEICAGAGGQALGLEWAGFEHVALVEIDAWSCTTLRHNRPDWNVIQQDLHTFSEHPYEGVDLLAGGVPCPPFSVAGHKRGHLDERDQFLRIEAVSMVSGDLRMLDLRKPAVRTAITTARSATDLYRSGTAESYL